MKTTANELCASCRNLRTPGGHRLEDFINHMLTNEAGIRLADWEHNSAIYSVLYAHIEDDFCSYCCELVRGRCSF